MVYATKDLDVSGRVVVKLKQRALRTYLYMSAGGFYILSGTVEKRKNV